MPIIIKDYKWKQTYTNVVIEVPMPETHIFNADVLITPRFVKASHEAYFFEAFLLHCVDMKTSKCTKTDKVLIFDLTKEDEKQWDSLELKLSRSEKMELKKKLLEEETDRVQKENETRLNKKAELKRAAVSAQISLDTKIREKIENIKKREECLALGDIKQWTKEIDNGAENIQQSNNITDSDSENTIMKSPSLKSVRPVSSRPKRELNKETNKPRTTRSLQILFTEREFPTPSRESRMEEENEFLRKQAEVRRSVGFNSKDLRPEEKSPQYLLAKGLEFMTVKNYMGAISAFSFGIKLSPKFLELYIARSEANLAMGNFNNCVEDTSAALNLLKPALPINQDQRALCIGRRGLALCKLGFLKHGIPELEASLKLKKDEYFEEALNNAKVEFESVKEEEEKTRENKEK